MENYDKVLITQFLNIFKAFSEAKDYSEKLELMKKFWGDIKPPQIYNYTENCKITITQDESDKISFQFDCENIDFELFKQNVPDFAQFVQENYINNMKFDEKETNNQEGPNSATKEQSLDLNLMNNYYNININKNTKN